MVSKIVMPKLSLTMKTGSVVQWFKREGEKVEKGEPIVEVLSEKVTYDVEAPEAGVLRKIMAEEGMELPVGATLAFVVAPDEKLPEAGLEIEVLPAENVEEATTEKREKITERILASPAAKRLAREHNLDLSQIQGTGPEGRVGEEDVKRFIEGQATLAPHVKEEFRLAGIRKITAERLTSSFQTAPHSFVIMDVEMTKAIEIREKTQISYTAILVHAAAKALRENPMVNSSLVEGKIRLFDDVNVGVAVSTEKGLVVPVIRNVDMRPLSDVSTELEELAETARQGKLSKEQLTGGTFTVTNLGMYEVDMFLPIINPPETAILAAGRVIDKPFVADEKVFTKPVITLTLAYDHRVIDGAPAAEFLRKIKKIVEEEL